VLAGVALVAGGLLRAASVSPATALVAAGVVAAVGALIDLATRPRPHLAANNPGAARPDADEPDAGTVVDDRADRPAADEPGAGTGVSTVALLVVRPVVALLVLAIAGDLGVGAGLVAAVAVGAAALVRLPAGRVGTALRWTVAAVAVLGAVDLVVDGILSV
jgi:hypothetical protein